MPHERTLDELKKYGAVLVAQARELAEKLGQPVPPPQNLNTDDRAAVEKAVSEAHELLAEIRMKIPSEVSEVDWERMKVVDGRTGEEIWEGLADVIHELSRRK